MCVCVCVGGGGGVGVGVCGPTFQEMRSCYVYILYI